ncbi:uncharacterized protein GGS25DRAFT_219193 [Hypoxylon fragiforme]|uniref:uncharacterized protein n=1 Tax=Hypoxylon fragiforme TaxID=63214 RepID=UPI0020C6B739|nr:uncharacterized protein GGS25DRAFT_219193 [Hypoxylon fragiforme]KAI2609514.1 hypothetical protein GGS25DRAFT_219193 [Hypoxylon fragiforme]
MAENTIQASALQREQDNGSSGDVTSYFRFLDLPLELRNEVYAHLLVQPHPIACARRWFTTAARHLRQLARENAPDCCGGRTTTTAYACAHYDARLRPHTGILRSCRRLSAEALDVLYARNVFHVELERKDTFLRFFHAVGARNLSRVRYLRLVMWTQSRFYYVPGVTFFRAPALDKAAWEALLGGLRVLEVVVQVPSIATPENLPGWVRQLEGVLGFVGERVGEGTDVRVDDNCVKGVCEAVDRCFRGRPFRRVRTDEGDAWYRARRNDPVSINGSMSS